MAKEKVKKLTYAVNYEDSLVQDDYVISAYRHLEMTSPDILDNIRNIKRASQLHMLKQYHQSVAERNKASLMPLAHVINAFYNPGLNSIAIPAGIAQGKIYSPDQEAFLNFGAIGIIIGHELAHMFDNVGRLYDADGNYINWWSNKSNSKFEEKSRCFVKQYNDYSLGPKLKVDGNLTLGENMADAGGTSLAYKAYLKWIRKYKPHKLPGLENYSLKQMFWISVGNTWCDKIRPEMLETFFKTDTHCIGNFRVLGPLSNSKEFSNDFKCPGNAEMNRKDKCTIW